MDCVLRLGEIGNSSHGLSEKRTETDFLPVHQVLHCTRLCACSLTSAAVYGRAFGVVVLQKELVVGSEDFEIRVYQVRARLRSLSRASDPCPALAVALVVYSVASRAGCFSRSS